MSFCGSINSTEREIYAFELKKEGDEIIFEITGNGFLYNMVRIIVGTLFFIGKGKLEEGTIEKMLQSGQRKLGGKTFPACGLTLKQVEYMEYNN